MAESIRFDFLSSGADKLAGAFKKTGDNAALAARGAKVLQDAIKSLGDKENRTAAESRLLASALKQTGDAEDRAAAKALAAEIAISRLDEAMKKNERAALEDAAANRALGDSFDKLAEKAGGPSLRGALAALSPALIPVTGGIAAGVGAIGVSFGAAALGAGLFAKAASSVLSNASQNLHKLQALEVKVNTARTAAQKKAAQEQVKALTSTWSAGYLDMIDALKNFKQHWTQVSQAIAVPALTAGIHALDDAIGFLGPAVKPVAALFTSWGQAIDRYFKSNAGSAEMNRLATAFGRFSADQLSALGVFFTDIGRAIFNLGKDLGLNAGNFGQFSVYLDQWGGAFLRWSQSSAARADVNKFLAYIHANGPVVRDLLKNLGATLATFAPGLTSVGSLELRLVSDFLGFLSRTPKSIAKPLVDVAGALLLLQKTGVLSVGIKIVGAAAKWLSGGVLNLGSGAAAAAQIEAAFTSGGATAAAEIRAALTGAAAPGAGGAAGGAAAGGLSGAFAAAGLVAAGAFAGAFIKALGDKLSPKGTAAGRLNQNLQQLGTSASTSLLHSFTFGGLESWLADKFGIPVGKAINDTLTFLGGRTKAVTGQAGKDVGGLADVWQQKMAMVRAAHERAMEAAGRASDNLRTRNLIPLQRKVGDVSGGIQGLAGMITNRLDPAFSTGGARSDAFRTRNLIPLQRKVGDVSGGIQGLQHYINILHGKTVTVGVHGSGSGGVQVTPSSGVPGAKNYAVYFKPAARGMYVASGRLGVDDQPILAQRGELVVPPGMVRAGAVDHLRGRIPGFAAGGLIGAGSLAGAQAAVAGGAGTDSAAEMRVNVNAVVAAIRAAIKASQAAGAGIRSTALGGDEGANRALARSIFPWPASMWPAFVDLEMREAGFNRFARNPSSGAYGIPQALPPTKMPFVAQAAGGSHAGPQLSWMFGYIRGRYGNPVAADQHELAYHWYDRGGWLKPGLTLAYNGTGRPEMVVPGSGRGGAVVHLEVTGSGSGTFDAFLLKWIRENVRVRGGGNVQAAFGRG